MSYKILIVDDETANLRLLERLFRRQYQIVSADSGAEALELLMLHDVALILSDQRMPNMTGIEFLKRAAELRPQTVRIILTGYTDVNALVEAINSGVVYKYVTKPWVNEDLQQTVERALQHYETIKEQHKLRLQNQRLQARLKTNQESFVRVVTEMVNLKDPHASDHCRRTSDYAVAIGQYMGFEPGELEQLSMAALLHEAAHTGIPNHLLFKTTPLTEEERKVFEQNFERGLELLASVPDLEEIVSNIRYLHESWDGSGYLIGLGGEQIPLHSRILAVADAFDELTAPRFSQTGLTNNEALERLLSAAGKKFDPEVVTAFCESKSTRQTHKIIMDGGSSLTNLLYPPAV
jgi:putative two-component system response regulator